MPQRTLPTFAVRKAIVAALRGHEELSALLGATNAQPRVFEYVPENQPFPYLDISNDELTDWSFSSSDPDELEDTGAEQIVTIHVWSRNKGASQAETIFQLVREILHGAHFDLTAEGHRLVNLRYQTGGVMNEGDQQTYHGVAQFRAVTEEV